MTQRVIDGFEFIYVNHHQRTRTVFFIIFVIIEQHHADQFFRGAFVQQAGEAVGSGTLFQFQFQKALFCHVIDQGDDAVDISFFIIGRAFDQLKKFLNAIVIFFNDIVCPLPGSQNLFICLHGDFCIVFILTDIHIRFAAKGPVGIILFDMAPVVGHEYIAAFRVLPENIRRKLLQHPDNFVKGEGVFGAYSIVDTLFQKFPFIGRREQFRKTVFQAINIFLIRKSGRKGDNRNGSEQFIHTDFIHKRKIALPRQIKIKQHS